MGFHHSVGLHYRIQKTRYCGSYIIVKKETMIIDVAMPGDTRVCDKEREKIEKYSLLKDEIARLWQMKKVVVIVLGTLETITAKF